MHPDENALDDFFAAATPMIEELVTRALRQGQATWQLGIVVERKFNGEVTGGCGARGALASRIATDARLPIDARNAIVNTIVGVGLAEIPVVLLIHCEGYVAGGIRRVSGPIVGVS